MGLTYRVEYLRSVDDDDRVIYRIESPDVVLVVKIGHWRQVYEE